MKTNTAAVERDDGGAVEALAQLNSIMQIVNALVDADPDSKAYQNALTAIYEDPLSVEVRSGWYAPTAGDKPQPEEYCILLCTGGPAVRIIGGLDQYLTPEWARLEYQDWGTPWTAFNLPDQELAAVLVYAAQFYYGN